MIIDSGGTCTAVAACRLRFRGFELFYPTPSKQLETSLAPLV